MAQPENERYYMIYYFKFDAAPSKNNRYYGRTGYSEASIFVSGDFLGDDLDAMETVARSYITAQSWVPISVLEIHETKPPAPDWEQELLALYQNALHFGVSGYFVASPKEDIPDGPSMRIRPY